MTPACLQVTDILGRIGYSTVDALEEAIIQCGVFQTPEIPEFIAARKIQGVDSFQMPNQLAPFLLHLNRYAIQSYLEIGVFSGGTFYIVDSYLRLTQPGYRGGIALDNVSAMRDWEAYREVHPATRFICSESYLFTPPPVDLVFVDGGHKYWQVRDDFLRFKNWTNLIAFHDIVSAHPSCPGTKRHWEEIKDDYASMEFTAQYEGAGRVMGIGLLDLARPQENRVKALRKR